MPAWKIAVISLGLFFGVMALGMLGGALEVLLHTRKKVADPDPAPSTLDFGGSGQSTADDGGEKAIQNGGEGEDSEDDGATAVNGEEGFTDGENEKMQGDRFSWQDEQGVQMEVWNEGKGVEEDASSQDHDTLEAPHGMLAAGYPQQPEPAYAGGPQHEGDGYYEDDDDAQYPPYQHQDLGAPQSTQVAAEGHEEGHYDQHEEEGMEEAAHDEDVVQDVHGQRMTRYEPWVPQMDDEFHEIALPEHGSQSETTHQQHPAEYI